MRAVPDLPPEHYGPPQRDKKKKCMIKKVKTFISLPYNSSQNYLTYNIPTSPKFTALVYNYYYKCSHSLP